MGAIENGNFGEEGSEELLFQEEQKSTNDAIDFLGEEESGPIVEKYQEKLDGENYNASDFSVKNTSNTKKNISDWFSGSISVGYSKINREKPEAITKTKVPTVTSKHLYFDTNRNNRFDEGEKRAERVGNFNDFANYNTTSEIQDKRNKISSLEEQNSNLVFVEKLGIITKRELNDITQDNNSNINKSQRIIDINERRDLTKSSRSILDSFKEAEKNGQNVTDVLISKYKDASESDKIKLLQTVGDKMGDNYDHSLYGKLGDVSKDQMWNSLIDENLLGGICRHIHSEISILAEGIGMTAGMISTNSGGERGGGHAVSILKREDGSFVMIDYGNVYEGRNFEELQANYLDQKGATVLSKMITDPEGNPLRFFQTKGAKLFSNNVSALGTSDTLRASQEIGKNGLIINDGFNVDIKNGSSEELSMSFGNGDIEGTIYHKNDGSGLYQNYTSSGVSLKGKIGSREENGELGAAINISEHNFGYFSGKQNSYGAASLAATYSKEVTNTDKYTVNFGVSGQASTHWKGGILSNEGLSGGEGSIGMTLSGEYQLNNNLTLKGSLGYGGDIGINLRSTNINTLDFNKKQSIGAGFDFQGNGYNTGVNVSYEKGLGYNEFGAEGYIENGDIRINAGYTKNSDTTKFGIGDDINKFIGVQYKVTDTLSLGINYSKQNNYGNENNNFFIGGEWKF